MIEPTKRDRTAVFKELYEAFNHVKVKMGLALALGAGLLVLKELTLAKHPLSGAMVEHFGVAFLVSGIVIFGFEWHGHEKHIQDMMDSLRESADKLEESQAGLNNKAFFQRQLPTIFPDRFIEEPFEKLMDHAEKLKESPVWTRAFVGKMLSRIEKHTRELVTLSNSGDHYIGMLINVVDDLMTLQIMEMGKGDGYDAISDLKSWEEERLVAFHSASIKKIGEGLKIRRIFNLVDESLNEKAINVLEDHINNSKDSNGNYLVKVLVREDLDKVGHSERKDLPRDHFGIFTQQGNDELRVKVESSGALGLSTDTTELVGAQYRKRFEAAWLAASPLNDAWIESAGKKMSEMEKTKAEGRGAGMK
jgi:hypothetical protein